MTTTSEQTRTAGLLELAERCERATRADWQLSKDIFRATGGLPDVCFGSKVVSWFGDGPFGCSTEDGKRHIDYINAPAYTGSLDAAMTLVPAEHAVSVEWSRQFPGYAWIYPPDNTNDISFQGGAASPALALCAAALRARFTITSRSTP
jgi:hypothetical protein